MSKYFRKSDIKYVRRRWDQRTPGIPQKLDMLQKNFMRMAGEDETVPDAQTCYDLGLDRAFLEMDMTFSNAGQQRLYGLSRTLVFDEDELKRRDKIIRFLQSDQQAREKIQCLMCYLGMREFDSAAECLYGELPKLRRGRGLFNAAAVAMLLALATIPFLKLPAIIPIIVVMMINITIHFLSRTDSGKAMPGIRGIARMLEAAQELRRLDIPELNGYYNDFFDEVQKKCGIILRKVRLYGAGNSADPLGVSALLQAVFLSEERTYLGCARYIREYKETLRCLYNRLGELDAFQAVASYRRTLSPLCSPQFVSEDRCLRTESIGHPMLKNAVCNDITLDGKNLVLTGSNMSGKSTFLRTIGYNAVLAQTFYMVKAKRYEASMFRIASSISPSDDLETGKSYYMTEAQTLLGMLPLCEGETGALLLIDEIFRGTNPLERVAGASSLLTYLSKRNCLVLVATHDIEITKNVQELYESHHFEEQVSKDSLEFDYILRPGTLKKPNGIHILEYIGFPDEITKAALETVQGEFRHQ